MAYIESIQYSPGIKIREIDLSAYAPLYAPVFYGIVGTAPRGRTDRPTFVGSIEEMTRLLGIPRTNDYGLWATYCALSGGASVYFMRVVGAGATKASGSAVDTQTTPATCLTFRAISEGTWGNNLTVEITNLGGDSYRLIVKDSGQTVHRFDYVSTDINSPYHITRLLENSNYVEVQVVSNNAPKTQTIALSGGTDGGIVDANAIVAGLDKFASREDVDIDVLLAPSWVDDTVVSRLVAICEARKDCITLIDTPPNQSPEQVKDWVNGVGLTRPALNTSYGACYYPWVYMVNPFVGGTMFLPPTSVVPYVIAVNDSHGVQYAPAGLNRGRLPFLVGTERKLYTGDLELLQSPDVRVNPIINSPKFGAIVWGQKTLQTVPTSLDRLNVRRYLLQLEKSLASLAMNYVFEPNTTSTRKRFVADASKLLNYGIQVEAIKSYTIKCDDEVNPPTLVENNVMRAVITITPVKSAEKIWIDVVLTSQGVDFTNRVGG